MDDQAVSGHHSCHPGQGALTDMKCTHPLPIVQREQVLSLAWPANSGVVARSVSNNDTATSETAMRNCA
jgi:hypothetical protein